ncbi:hypothetical protein CHARACLAT_032722 [Characodon lateralis]|uniref:Uncharacterized protein n=1 Tax=Characodon lateralis TaxID=208331 RepID=A0ABU7CTX0_9TELE|nr:hypothetical protein [Characodon lateralis]
MVWSPGVRILYCCRFREFIQGDGSIQLIPLRRGILSWLVRVCCTKVQARARKQHGRSKDMERVVARVLFRRNQWDTMTTRERIDNEGEWRMDQ